MPTCAHLLSFLKIPEFVGSTDMGSLVEFSQTLGVVWTSLGPLPRWVPGPTTRWAPGTTRLALHDI
jgi:hypothetical protein